MNRRTCWKSNVEHASDVHGEGSPEALAALDAPGTCVKPKGHPGPHEFTPDQEVSFVNRSDRTGMDILKSDRKIGEV